MYVYQDYPKCLYQGTQTRTVTNAEDEAEARQNGWLTAAQFHQYPDAEPVPETKAKKKKGE